MSDDIYDKHVARVLVAIFKAVSRPELLPYMRRQLLKDITHNIEILTDEEICESMKRLKVLLTNDAEKDRSV